MATATKDNNQPSINKDNSKPMTTKETNKLSTIDIFANVVNESIAIEKKDYNYFKKLFISMIDKDINSISNDGLSNLIKIFNIDGLKTLEIQLSNGKLPLMFDEQGNKIIQVIVPDNKTDKEFSIEMLELLKLKFEEDSLKSRIQDLMQHYRKSGEKRKRNTKKIIVKK